MKRARPTATPWLLRARDPYVCTSGDKDKLDGSPFRWDFAVHLLDALFEASWNGKACSPEVTVDAASQTTLEQIGTIFREGATEACKFSMQREPHYVLLRKDYYTRTTTVIGYKVERRADGAYAMAPGTARKHEEAVNRASLVQLMAAWAIEWLAVQPAFQEDIERLLSEENRAPPKHVLPYAELMREIDAAHARIFAEEESPVSKAERERMLHELSAPLSKQPAGEVREGKPSGKTKPQKLDARKPLRQTVIEKLQHTDVTNSARKFCDVAREAVRTACRLELFGVVKVFVIDHASSPDEVTSSILSR